MNKTVYRIVVMCVVVVLLFTGTYIGLKISDNTQEIVVPTSVNDIYDTTTPVSNTVEDKNIDIEVTYEDYYTGCSETITNKNTEFGTTIDKIKEKVDKSYTIADQTENSITFRREIDSNCPNHFELKLVDDYVIIYTVVSNEVSVIYKNTEIPKSNIREEMVSELEKGIRVNSLEELTSYIEDIES